MSSSIKRKIMILLSLTSLLSSGVFLIYSIIIFEKDKTAYIYDSNAMYLDAVTSQFANELKLASEISKKYLSDYQKNKSFSTEEDVFLEEDSFAKGLFLVDITNTNKPILIDKITVKSNFTYKITEESEFLKSIPRTLSESRSLFLSGDLVYISDMVYNSIEKIALVTVFKSDALDAFFDNQSTQSFLLNTLGNVLRQTSSLNADYLSSEFPNLVSVVESVKMGTSEIRSKDNELWLMSSSNLGIDNMYLFTLTNKKEAFGVLRYLINKALIVFLMVLSGVVLVSQFASAYITKRILNLYEAAKQIINGNFKVNVEVKGNDEIALLSQTFNHMSVEIVKLLEDTAQNARLEAELKTAQAVQQTLFPPSYSKFECGEIHGSYQSASECGGDWWHYFENKKQIWFWMADATGHGAPAALITSAIKSAVTMTENLQMDPLLAIDMVNKSICRVSNNKMMMTCFLGVIDKKTKIISYINASHEAPIVLGPQSDLRKKDLRFLDNSKCNRLGQSIDSEFVVATEQLNVGDRIFVYTDGIPDLQNKNHESLLERGMIKFLLENHNRRVSVSEFISDIHSQFETYRDNTELIDDVTYFALDIQ